MTRGGSRQQQISLDAALGAAGIEKIDWVQIVSAREAAMLAMENALGEVADQDQRLPWRAPLPTVPLLLIGLEGAEIVRAVARWLRRYYPMEHPVRLVRGGLRIELSLKELDGEDSYGAGTMLLVPPLLEMENVRTFAGMMNLTRTLRAPGGCPWDREQTHATLKPHLLEEAYEVLDALDSGDPNTIAEEMGDLLYQITIHSQVAAEAGDFAIEDVIESIMRKLIGRHPHVFGDLELGTAHDVRQAWESFKQREKPKRASVLEEIPRGLPALPQSNLMQKRAASVGFAWPDAHDVIAKVQEEMRELERDIDEQHGKERQLEELGDVLFALVSLARHLKLDPEEALRLANRKFARRFQAVESGVAADGKTIRDLSPDELSGAWEQAKSS
jgi:tetrapyrrole methylase family protein/MazG family protein